MALLKISNFILKAISFVKSVFFLKKKIKSNNPF